LVDEMDEEFEDDLDEYEEDLYEHDKKIR